MIPVGILNQFSGLPLDKQVWVSFGVGYSDAGVFVNKITGSHSPVSLKTADGNDMGDFDLAGIEGGIISDAGASSGVPQELNRMRLISGDVFSSGLQIYLDGDVSFTAYIFWVIPVGTEAAVMVNFGSQNFVSGSFNSLPATTNRPQDGYQVNVPTTSGFGAARLLLGGNVGNIEIAAVCLILD